MTTTTETTSTIVPDFSGSTYITQNNGVDKMVSQP